MKNFTSKIDDSEIEYEFECYENTEPIEVGDKYIFFFAGIADVQRCWTEHEMYEINENDRVRNNKCVADLVTGFWKNCYKIKTTNFDLTKI